MTDLTTPLSVRAYLHKELEALGNFEDCALLDHPDYANIGDHLIWLGTLFYLIDVLQTKIKYAASVTRFSAQAMEKNISPDAPILLQGGGNMGDLWPIFQDFREKIATQYPNRRIIILPQTIYFKNPENLKKAAKAFNSHPNLTLFVRDDTSYAIAQENFHKCRILKAPDMAFHLVGMPDLNFQLPYKKNFLYHCRSDHEPFPISAMNLPNVVQSDWISYKWVNRENIQDLKAWYWKIPGIIRLYREGWQRGLTRPSEWLARQEWQKSNPNLEKLNSVYNPSIHHKSWMYMHAGIYQLKPHRLIITNRTHGHITCMILGIPHVFAPGSYFKNEAFYKAWTHQIPFCKWVTEASQVKPAVEELLEKFPNHFSNYQ